MSATGARLVVGVADARAADWSSGEHAEVEAAVTTLLTRTAPPESYPAELRRTWWYVPVGLLALARAQLQGAAALHTLGHLRSVGPVLARTVFEHVATALWIAEDPSERTRGFIQYSNLQLQLLAEQAPGWDARLQDARARWDSAYGQEPFTARLPPFEQRLIEPIRGWYPRYRDLSSRTHPTTLAIDALLEVADDAVRVRVDGPDARMLAFAAVMVWTLALQVETGFARADGAPSESASTGAVVVRRTGLGVHGDLDTFAALGATLNRHTTA